MSIKKARLIKGYTQNQMAKLLGVSRTTFNKYENNVHSPDKKTLVKMAEVLNCSVDYLLEVENTLTPEINQFEQEILGMLKKLSEGSQKKAVEYLEMLKMMDDIKSKNKGSSN